MVLWALSASLVGCGQRILDLHTLPSSAGEETGGGGSGATLRYFSEGWMYDDISGSAVHKDSAVMLSLLEDHWDEGLTIDFGMPVLETTETTKHVFKPKSGTFYEPDCDCEDVPLPAHGALEGESGYQCSQGGTCHLLVVDRSHARLYEQWSVNVTGDQLISGCQVVWQMDAPYPSGGRGDQCTGADASGLPMAPLLITPEEVARGDIGHALRLEIPNESMALGFFVHPATHGPKGDTDPTTHPAVGSRWRLHADFEMSRLPSEGARTVARALQTHGMVLVGVGNFLVTATTDQFATTRWEGLLSNDALAALRPTDFDVIAAGEPIPVTNTCVRTTTCFRSPD